VDVAQSASYENSRDIGISPRDGMAVSCTGLCRRYGSRWALVNVSLAASYGTAFLVVGHNGSGKTTLFRILATAVSYDRGAVTIAGFDPGRQRYDARRNVTLVSHHTYLYESLTAFENLDLVTRAAGATSSRNAILAVLEQVALEERAHDFVAGFSAGMRKRLSLARALIRPTSIVLFDEPYGQLDPQGFALVDRIIEASRRRGAAVLLATHQVERGQRLCGDALVLDGGRCVFHGRAADLPDFNRGSFLDQEDTAS
jgi:heme exporter protein A